MGGEDLPSLISATSESSDCQTSHSRGTQSAVSARKLAGALWGMNKTPSPKTTEVLHEKRSKKERRVRGKMMRSSHSGSLLQHLLDPSHTPGSKVCMHSSHRRMKCQIYDKSRCNRQKDIASDLQKNASLMQTNACCRGRISANSVEGSKSRSKDLGNCLTASRELLKAIIRVLGPHERHSSAISLVSALRAEIYQASEHLASLMGEKNSSCCETIHHEECFSEEKERRKLEEKKRIRCLIQPIVIKLESEKVLRKRTERVNKELGIEFAKLKDSLMETTRELENEKRSRETVEKICSELLRECGKEKAVVEELRRRYEKVRDELEREREMLRIADEWREERVQMKLYEAKLEFEEKNAVVDRLRNELEAFLNAKRTEEPESDKDEEEKEGIEEDDEIESQDSDLHSIELNITPENEIETRLNLLEEHRKESNYGGSFLCFGNKLVGENCFESDSFRGKEDEREVRDEENYVKRLWGHLLSDSKDATPQNLPEEEGEACEESNVAEMVKAMRERANGEIIENGGTMFQSQIQIASM